MRASAKKSEWIKQIIGREGLVILGVLVVSGILLWIHYLIPYDDSKSSYVYFCSTGGKRYTAELKDDWYLFSKEQGYKIFTALHAKYPKNFFPDKEGQYRLPRDFKIDYARVKFSLPGQIKNTASNLALWLLIIVYPVYLIFRCIVWNIRLLIEDK